MGAVSDLFSIGRSALNAYSTALATTSHNVANAATPGFSRQRVDFATQTPTGVLGNGVQAAQVRRINDTYLQSRLTDDGAAASRHGTARDLLIRADKMLSDPLSGLAAPLQTFNAAVQGLMADPASLSARRVVLAEAQGMADRFAQLDAGFAQMDREIDGRMASTVSAANGLIDDIAKLNLRIAQSTGGLNGLPPGDLLDQRDEAVRQLAEQIGVTTLVQDSGAVSVFLEDGQALVLDGQARHLNLVATTATGRYRLTLDAPGGAVPVGRPAGGAMAGLFDARAQAVDAPRAAMAGLASELAGAFNAAQAAGQNLDGNPGTPLFSDPPLRLAIDDPRQLAPAGPPPAGVADNSAWDSAARYSGAALSARAAEVVGQLGLSAQQADARASAASSLAEQALTARESVSGVNLDEEAANLLRYQQSYQAAAQMIATADTVFQTLLSAVRR